MRLCITLFLVLISRFPGFLIAGEPINSKSLWTVFYNELNVTPYPTFWNQYTDSIQEPALETFVNYNNIINTKYRGNRLHLRGIAYGVSASNPVRTGKKNFGSLFVSYSSIVSDNKWRFRNNANHIAYNDDVRNYKIGYKHTPWKNLSLKATIGIIQTYGRSLMQTGFQVGYNWPQVNIHAGYNLSGAAQYGEFSYDNVIVYAPVKMRVHSYYAEVHWRTNDYFTVYTAGRMNLLTRNVFDKNRFLTMPDINNYNIENRIFFRNGVWCSELYHSFSRTPALARLTKNELQYGSVEFPGLDHHIADWSFGWQPAQFVKFSAGYSYVYGSSNTYITLNSWPFAPSIIDILGAEYHTRLNLDYSAHGLYAGGVFRVNSMNQLQYGAKLLFPSFRGTASYQQVDVGDITIDKGSRSLNKKISILSSGITLKTGYKKFGMEMSYFKVIPVSLFKKDRIANREFKILDGGDFIHFFLRFYI